MELYTIFAGNERFMQREYSKQHEKINGNLNETYDLAVESLFGHRINPGPVASRPQSHHRGSPALRCARLRPDLRQGRLVAVMRLHRLDNLFPYGLKVDARTALHRQKVHE